MASSATPLRSSGVRMNAVGSRAFTPNKKLARKCVSPERSADADDHTGKRQGHPLADNHVAQGGSLRSQRHADPQFLRALLHRVSHKAIHSDRRHQQCRGAEDTQQQHVQSLTRGVGDHQVFHGVNVRDRQAAAGFTKGCGHRLDQRMRVYIGCELPTKAERHGN